MIKTKDLLPSEQKLTPGVAGIALSCVLTGVITYAINSHSVWLQWTVLVHILTGVACSLLLVPYLIIHFRRTVGFRRANMLLSGLLTILLLASFVLSGWYMMIHGQLESQRWIYDTHLISGFAFIAIVLMHLVMHVKFLPEKRKQSETKVFASIPGGILKQVGFIVLAITLFVLVSTLIYQQTLPEYSVQPAVENYEYAYGKHRFRPSQTESANGAFIDKKQIANSERCINCHQDVAEQWMTSMHKQAASDPTYVTNVSLLAEKKGIASTRYCEGCHAPVALLSGELSQGGEHGGIAGSIGNVEGVSCMSCHGINSVQLTGVASYEFKPAEDYLFAQSDNPFLLRIHDLMVKVRPDQHKRDLGKSLFKDSKFCASCHTQFMDKDMNDWGWVRMQDEYAAWLESPFSKHHKEDFSNTKATSCQDCHMPLVESDDPSSNYKGLVRSHHFPGANTVLPVLNSDAKQLAAIKQFLQSNKLRVNIDKPNRADALQTSQALDETLRNYQEAPYYFYLGEESNIRVVVSNNGVGHDFPGGTIDINQAWVEFMVVDAEGTNVYTSGDVDAITNKVDSNAYFYGSHPVDRKGKHVWKHDLFNMVGESFKRVIQSGKSDIVDFKFTVPAWAKSPLTITATLKYRKLNDRYARWALKDNYIKIPIVDMAWDSLSIPLKIRKEVEQPE